MTFSFCFHKLPWRTWLLRQPSCKAVLSKWSLVIFAVEVAALCLLHNGDQPGTHLVQATILPSAITLSSLLSNRSRNIFGWYILWRYTEQLFPNFELTLVATSISNITLFIILSKIRTWDLIWKNFYVRAKFSLTLLFFEPTVGGQENWERQCPWAKLINISISIAPPHRQNVVDVEKCFFDIFMSAKWSWLCMYVDCIRLYLVWIILRSVWRGLSPVSPTLPPITGLYSD